MICVHDRRIFKNLTNMRYLALSLILLFFNCKPTKAIETPKKDETDDRKPDDMDDFKQDQAIDYQTDY